MADAFHKICGKEVKPVFPVFAMFVSLRVDIRTTSHQAGPVPLVNGKGCLQEVVSVTQWDQDFPVPHSLLY